MTESIAPTEPFAEALEGYEDTEPGASGNSAIRKANAAPLLTILERIFQTEAIA